MRTRGRGPAQRGRQGGRAGAARPRAVGVGSGPAGQRPRRLRDRAEVHRRWDRGRRCRGRALQPRGGARARVQPDAGGVLARRAFQRLLGSGADALNAAASVSRPAFRIGLLGAYILGVEWARTLVATAPYAAVPALGLGGVALALT